MKKLLGATALLAAIASTPAQAIPITFDLSGTAVNRQFVDNSGGFFTDTSVAGQAFQAQITIETAAFHDLTSFDEEGYRALAFATGFADSWTASLTLAGESIPVGGFAWNSADVRVYDSKGPLSCGEGCYSVANDGIGISVSSWSNAPIGATYRSSLSLNAFERYDLFGGTPSNYTNLDAPFDLGSLATIALPNPSLYFSSTYLDCRSIDLCFLLYDTSIRFDVTSVTRTSGAPASVPEPGTLALFAAGLLGAGFARRRKARVN